MFGKTIILISSHIALEYMNDRFCMFLCKNLHQNWMRKYIKHEEVNKVEKCLIIYCTVYNYARYLISSIGFYFNIKHNNGFTLLLNYNLFKLVASLIIKFY